MDLKRVPKFYGSKDAQRDCTTRATPEGVGEIYTLIQLWPKCEAAENQPNQVLTSNPNPRSLASSVFQTVPGLTLATFNVAPVPHLRSLFSVHLTAGIVVFKYSNIQGLHTERPRVLLRCGNLSTHVCGDCKTFRL